jgi:hypothetical protein
MSVYIKNSISIRTGIILMLKVCSEYRSDIASDEVPLSHHPLRLFLLQSCIGTQMTRRSPVAPLTRRSPVATLTRRLPTLLEPLPSFDRWSVQ